MENPALPPDFNNNQNKKENFLSSPPLEEYAQREVVREYDLLETLFLFWSKRF